MKLAITTIIILFITSLCANAQNVEKLVDKFSQIENINYKRMDRKQIDSIQSTLSNKIPYIEILKYLDSLEILDFSKINPKDTKLVKAKLEKIKWKDFESLITNKNEEYSNMILTRIKNKVIDIEEVVIITIVDDVIIMIRMKGQIPEDKMKKIFNTNLK